MQTKLHINVSQGLIEVEGDAALVREVYSDFKAKLLSAVSPVVSKRDDNAQKSEIKQATKRRASSRRKVPAEEGKGSVNPDAPRLDKNLDTSKLTDFYGVFEPKNHPEKILIFMKFLVESLGIDSPNTDQIYTCYRASNEKIPKAFRQVFHDTSNKSGFIEYKSATEIAITIVGENHFHHALKKKADV